MSDRTIGKVAVKVIPDTKNFKKELKAELDQIEKGLNPLRVKIDFNPAQVKAQVKKMHETAQSAMTDIKTKLDVKNDPEVVATIAALTRDRTVEIKPEVNNAAAAKVAAALGVLSGFRILHIKFDHFVEFIKNIDTASIEMSILATKIAAVTGVSLAASGQLLSLGASIASIAGAGFALPGILGGFALGLIATAVTLKDFNKVFSQFQVGIGKQTAGAAWKKLQDQMSANFWDKAKQPMQDMLQNLFPKFSAGMNQVSTSLGGFFAGLATGLSNALGPRMQTMFASLSSSIEIATGSTGALSNIIGILGQVGAAYLPRLAQWFTDIANKFNGWLTQAASDGRLQGFIDNGINALKALGSVIVNVVEIFNGLATAASNAGGTALQGLATGLGRIADVVNSEPFQTQLTEVFRSAYQMMTNVATIAGPMVSNAFSHIGDILQAILPSVGNTLGILLNGVATALSNPTLQVGITDMFNRIESAAKKLEPIWPAIGQALGALAPVIGQVTDVLAGVFAKSLESLAPVVENLAPVLGNLVQILGDGLTKAVGVAEPIIVKISKAFADLMNNGGLQAIKKIVGDVGAVFALLAPIVGDLVERLINGLQPILPKIADAFDKARQVIEPLLPVLEFIGKVIIDSIIMAIDGVVNVITGALDIIIGVFNFFKDLFTGNWSALWGDVEQIFTGIWEAIKGAFEIILNLGVFGIFKKGAALIKGGWEGLWTGVKEFFVNILESAKGLWDDALNWVKGKLSSIGDGIKSVWNSIWTWVKDLFSNAILGIRDAAEIGLQAVLNFFKDLPGNVMDAVGSLLGKLKDFGSNLLHGLWEGIQGASKWLLGKIGDFFGGLLPDWVKDMLGIHSPSKVFAEFGEYSIKGFVVGLESQYDAAHRSLKGFANDLSKTDMGTLSVGLNAVGSRVSGMVDNAYGTGGITSARTLNYYAAAGSSISSEEDLFAATNRARSGW